MNTGRVALVVAALVAVVLVVRHSRNLQTTLTTWVFAPFNRWYHRAQVAVVERMREGAPIRRGDPLPDALRGRVSIAHVEGFGDLPSARDKCDAAMSALCPLWPGACRDDLVVFDVLQARGAYLPGMHTDTEWNKVVNDGYQVWCLEENQNDANMGNMFIFANERLRAKYAGIGISVRVVGDEVRIVKNCGNVAVYMFEPTLEILERIPIAQFLDETTKHYLDVEAGDCVAFDRTLMHMSDYRDTGKKRLAINFRVAYRNEKGLEIDPEGCGYAGSVPRTIAAPGRYDLVE
jgi:hypothetical protein